MFAQISRGTGPTLFGSLGISQLNATYAPVHLLGLDAPGTASSTTYSVYIWVNSTNLATWISAAIGGQSAMIATEIMA
jgi:hypothetical protein